MHINSYIIIYLSANQLLRFNERNTFEKRPYNSHSTLLRSHATHYIFPIKKIVKLKKKWNDCDIFILSR